MASSAKRIDQWEKLTPDKPLGEGGQSTVFLVRRPERRDARKRSFETLMQLAGQGLNNPQVAQRFASASWDMARDDHPSELAALKIAMAMSPATHGAPVPSTMCAREMMKS